MTNRGRIDVSQQSAHPKDVDLDQLLEVVAELTEVMRQENTFLRGGMPAALSELGERKEALTRRLIELGRFGGLQGELDESERAANRRDLIAAGNALKNLTRENMLLLEGAMSASRRRIDSVMRAIHAHEGRPSGGSALDFRISTMKFDV